MNALTRHLATLGLLLSLAAGAQEPDLATEGGAEAQTLAVIVHPGSGVESLNRTEAVNIFMGRYRKLPSGLLAFPIDVGPHSAQRRTFYERLVGKTLAEVEAYWSRLIFSGQTSPPLQVPSDRTAVDLVAGNRAAIAYVWRSSVDDRVRVVLELPPP